MKIYSDTLNHTQLYQTALKVDGLMISALSVMPNPKLRAKGYVVTTTGNTKRWKNSGIKGPSYVHAATWDQHGEWINLLYQIDPLARIADYKDAKDFHHKTKNKYNTQPALTSN